MQLGNDDTFRAIDNKGTGCRHQRQFAHVDFLFLHFLDDRFRRRFLVKDNETNLGTQRCGQSQSTLLTFLDVKRRIT